MKFFGDSMGLFNFRNKMDKTISPYIGLNSKRKLPVIVCYRGNSKFVKTKITHLNGSIKHEYLNLAAFSCELSPLSAQKISELPEITYVAFDHKASLCLRKARDEMGFSNNNSLRLTGRNIGIGILDTGVFPHPDLVNKRNSIKFFYDVLNSCKNPYDDNGHGTFVCGCINSTGKSSDGLYRGIAPESDLYVIKAFDAIGRGYMSDIISGIDILLALSEKENLKILCLPFEFAELEDTKLKPMIDIIEIAIKKGLTVITPAGNSGSKPYSIYCPGNIAEVITVGGTGPMEANVKTLKTSPYSGRGPTTANLPKPDLCAPSGLTTSLSSNVTYLPGKSKFAMPQNLYTTASGTSISCALIAGFAALLLEKNNTLSPSDLKSVLNLLTTSYGESKFSQGSGFFDFSKLS